MKSTTRIFFHVLAIFWYCLAFSGIAAADMPMAVFDATERDFGRVKQGTLVSEVFLIRNVGKAALLIEKVDFSLPGIKIRVKQQIEPGETAEARVEWDTSHYIQQTEGQAALYLNDPEQSKVVLTLKGTVYAPIDILPRPAVYLSQFRQENKTRSVSIVNNQAHQVAITRLEPRGEHFHAGLETVDKGKSYKLNVGVPPDTPVGRYRELVVLHTDDPEHPRIPIEVNVLVKPDIFITPDQVDFGQLTLAQIKNKPEVLDLIKQTLLIKRRDGEMTITSVTTDLPFLEVTHEPGGRAQAFRLDVGLDPDQLGPGLFKGSVKLKTDDPKFPELTIPVSGESQ